MVDVMEVAGVSLTVLATLFLGWAALAGPMRSLARAWLLVDAAAVGAAMVTGSEWTAILAALAMITGVPIAGVMLWTTVERSRSTPGA